MKKLRLLDLFSGIGGFSLGLERSGGFETVAFCEIEPFPCRVLAKHWPGVPIYDDVEKLTAARLSADGIGVDAICGGFPCQDISTAGAGAGIEGARSGLWSHYARLIGELRPRVVFVENVAALLGRGLSRVCGDLAAIGYYAEWHCIPASHIGAPHRRDRLWLIAWAGALADAELLDRQDTMPGRRGDGVSRGQARQWREGDGATTGRGGVLADTLRVGLEGSRAAGEQVAPQTLSARLSGRDGAAPRTQNGQTESGMGRGVNGVSGWLDGSWERGLDRTTTETKNRAPRLKTLGNAVVPQIPELLGRAWIEYEAREAAL